ncbi:MAG: hypothetical protein R2792_06940 [Saprospiraceae bacterium]
MRTATHILIVLLLLGAWDVGAHLPTTRSSAAKNERNVTFRNQCTSSTSQIDLAVNNVRARLLGGGDCWWSEAGGRYIVPKVNTLAGEKEVSSLSGGGVWIGGLDPAGNLKIAAQENPRLDSTDFWPGPLNYLGTTEQFTCANWDRHFRVTSEEIREHLMNLSAGNLNASDIPEGVKGWPARGNPFFNEMWGFDLPFTNQALAGFYDADDDGNYNPLNGDFPAVEIRGGNFDRYPDEIIFWIYNDEGGGNNHSASQAAPIHMEIQAQAFAFATLDELNDATFIRYKLINRATERIDSCYMAFWADPELGCPYDDYIGVDTSKGLMYVYNQDAIDGLTGCFCSNINTYCEDVPILGIDFLRGPLDTFGEELLMSSFVYYFQPGIGDPPAGMTRPWYPNEYYNYLTGSWRDGTPLTYDNSGYAPQDPNAVKTKFAFSSPPNDAMGWSMCNDLQLGHDVATLQTAGPFTLLPGAVNELIVGIPWVKEADYPCPDLEYLFRADKRVQALFDGIIEPIIGPNPPQADWVELNQELILVLSNDSLSNNFEESYRIIDFMAPDAIANSPDPEIQSTAAYTFEGYQIYQLANPDVRWTDFNDPEKARMVATVDKKNGVEKIYNWEAIRDEVSGELLYVPELRAEGTDSGIRHTFQITDDKFATGNDKRLINHKRYYYSVVAYAHNNYADFDPLAAHPTGQQMPYQADGRYVPVYTVIPRPEVDQVLNAAYGDGVEVLRMEGQGVGNHFVELTPESRNAALAPDFDGVLTYKPGRGPIGVAIFNPFEVQDGLFELRIVDQNTSDTKLEKDAWWELYSPNTGELIASERSIAEINEQIMPQFGFAITIYQTGDAGDYTPQLEFPNLPGISPGKSNGGIGAEIQFADPNAAWLTGHADDPSGVFHFVKTRPFEVDERMDPYRGLSELGDGWFVPYALADWRLDTSQLEDRMITPAYTAKKDSSFYNAQFMGTSTNFIVSSSRFKKLNALRNVDIVLTKDKSLWSRCVVVETASAYWTSDEYLPKDPDLMTENPVGARREMFDVRYAPSVGKDDLDGDGLPDPDHAVDQNGSPQMGMGWFPGYALDVETGERLNVFFGENSCYHSGLNPEYTGRDMLWNPTDQELRGAYYTDYYDLVLGGQHWVYVMNTPYDSCQAIAYQLTPENHSDPAMAKGGAISKIGWTGMLQLADGYRMESLANGLIPNEVVISLRVDNPYQTSRKTSSASSTDHPRYQIRIDGKAPTGLDDLAVSNALDSIKMVPNPYYGFSQYETSANSGSVKITNLPAKCIVSIYTLDGKFIRQFKRDEQYQAYQQISPALEWDLKNSYGADVASGVYLIHVQAPGMGERTLKWFGVTRAFEPIRLE